MGAFDSKYSEYVSLFDAYSARIFDRLKNNPSADGNLTEAMAYSFFVGGKRIRPVLCYAATEILGGAPARVSPFAAAIEMVHTYSLIHDDLPAMDNDDFRRGKPSNHKKFGEGIAVLAGDGLLNLAMETALSEFDGSYEYITAVKRLFDCSGVNGMISGQSKDLFSEGKTDINECDLNFVYENKTAKLISAPLIIASALNGDKLLSVLKNVGYCLGMLFQITDDILDIEGDFAQMGKTLHKDEKEDKLTSVKIFGLSGAKNKAKFYYERAKELLSNIDGGSFLSELTEKIYLRKK